MIAKIRVLSSIALGLFLLLLLGVMVRIASAGPLNASLIITSSKTAVQPGETFVVTITLDTMDAEDAFQDWNVKLDYNEDVLVIGEVWANEDILPAGFDAAVAHYPGGIVKIGDIALSGDSGDNAPWDLATIHFTATAAGTSDFVVLTDSLPNDTSFYRVSDGQRWIPATIDVQQAVVAIAPTSVTITGPVTGTVGIAHTLTATVNPTNTPPISYVWQATGLSPFTHTLSSSHIDTATFTWSTTGTQFITVTAINAVGAVTGSHTINIVNDPPEVTDLYLDPANPDSDDNLTVHYQYYDPDGHPEGETQIRWTRDGVTQTDFNDQGIIPYTSTLPGEAWYVTVRPHDGYEYGKLVTSTVVTIGPSITVPVKVYLPLMLRDYTYSPYEENDTPAQAYGPLIPGQVYAAYPDDLNDWYYVRLDQTTSLSVTVTNYQTIGQLVVYSAGTPMLMLASDARGQSRMEIPNESIPDALRNLPPGIY